MHTFPEAPLPLGLMGSGDARLPGSAAPPGGLSALGWRVLLIRIQGPHPWDLSGGPLVCRTHLISLLSLTP